MSIIDVLDKVVEDLKGAGLSASVDPRDLNAPCVWVTANRAIPDTLCGGMDVHVDVFLIAPDSGTPQAYSTLNDMLTKALSVAPVDTDIDLGVSVTMPQGQVLPAFQFTTVLST